MHSILGKAGRATIGLLGRPVSRLILDVEQGVIAVHRLDPQTYLIGVGLYQNRVRAVEADDELAEPHSNR